MLGKSLLISLLSLGVVGAVVFAATRDESGPTADPRSDEAPGPRKRAPRPDADASLEDRVAFLEREVEDLREELDRSRVAAPVARWTAGGASTDDGETPDGPLADQVRSIVAQEREAEQERRMEDRRERWSERSEERLDELATKANLSAEHREAISNLWTAERDRMMSMFSEARSGDQDRDEVREAVMAMRQETDREVQGMLSADQYSAYLEVREEGRWGGEGRGGEGRGRPP